MAREDSGTNCDFFRVSTYAPRSPASALKSIPWLTRPANRLLKNPKSIGRLRLIIYLMWHVM